MRLTLVRHGETPGNVAGALDTAFPGPGLTERGEAQAAALVDRFRGQEFDAIFVSTLIRTQFTAAPIAADRGLVPQILDGLREFSAGDLEGRSDPSAIEVFVEVMREWFLGRVEVRMPGGETCTEILARMDDAIEQIVGTGDDSVLVVSHGGVLRLWAGARCANIETDFTVSNYLVNTGVIVVTGEPGNWHCASWDRPPTVRRQP